MKSKRYLVSANLSLQRGCRQWPPSYVQHESLFYSSHQSLGHYKQRSIIKDTEIYQKCLYIHKRCTHIWYSYVKWNSIQILSRMQAAKPVVQWVVKVRLSGDQQIQRRGKFSMWQKYTTDLNGQDKSRAIKIKTTPNMVYEYKIQCQRACNRQKENEHFPPKWMTLPNCWGMGQTSQQS